MKKKTILQRTMGYLKVLGFILLSIGAIYGLRILSEEQETMRAVRFYTYKYECDGKLLDDECNMAQITEAGTWIRDCRSGKEYVCQSIVEIPR